MTPDISQPLSAERDIAEIMARCRRSVGPALQAAIEHLHPWPGRMAAFTFGWCEADGTPRETQSGKGLRPAFTMLCAEAAGAPAETAVPGAVAIELVHAFSLVHDDIMDGDEQRRHRDTVWKAYGIGPAVLTGDALLTLAIATLARAEGAAETVGYLSTALVDLVHGEAEDLTFESRPWSGPRAVTVEEYNAMATRKTGSLLGAAAAIGAVLGGGSRSLGGQMLRMGRHLGLAFQAIDDLLGIRGDPDVTGKPVLSDLRQGKKTLPVVAAIGAGTEPARRLAELLDARQRDEDSLERAAELIDEAGGLSYTRDQAIRHLDQALEIIETAELDGRAARQLATLSRFMVHRTH
jgi:geranylgeranyl diphosphate synthase type I